MKQTDKNRTTTNQTKRSVRSQSRDNKLQQEKSNQPPKVKNAGTKSVASKADTRMSEEASQNIKARELGDQASRDESHKQNTNLEEESDCETVTDSVSSSGDSRATEDEKLETVPIVSRKPANKDGSENSSNVQIAKSTNATSASSSKNTTKSTNGVKVHPKLSSTPSSVSSEGIYDHISEEPKEVDILDNDETNDGEGKIEIESKESLDQKIEEMEMRIEKLEEELREVAALEISLYSVVPEHGSSAHKVHTPARRLSRLYIHAAKHYSQGKRATIAKNTASGLVLIAKSCGNDVPRYLISCFGHKSGLGKKSIRVIFLNMMK